MTVLEDGASAGLHLHQTATQLKSSLRLNLNETYLRLEQYEEARHCSELAPSAIGEFDRDTGSSLG